MIDIMEQDESSLIEQAKQGNESAFLTLLKKYTKIILIIIRSYIRNIVGYEEEDIQQEISMSAYRVLPKFRGDEVAFQCWLRHSTKGLCLNILEKQQKHETIDMDSLCEKALDESLPNRFIPPDAELELKEARTAVQQAIEELDEKYRKALVLKDIEGLKYEEIAQVLDIEIGTVKSRIGRARGMLRETLKQYR